MLNSEVYVLNNQILQYVDEHIIPASIYTMNKGSNNTYKSVQSIVNLD